MGTEKNTPRVLGNSSMRWDIRQLLPTQANRRCSEIVQLEVAFSASYMCTHSQHLSLSSGFNKLLFVLQSAYVIPCRNEQNAEQEALQLVQQPPLTDMRQLLGFNTPHPAMADPALQACGQVPSLCFACTHIITLGSGLCGRDSLSAAMVAQPWQRARHHTQVTA